MNQKREMGIHIFYNRTKGVGMKGMHQVENFLTIASNVILKSEEGV